MTELVVKSRNGCRYLDLFVSESTRGVTSATVDKYSKLIYPESKFCIQAVWNSYKFKPEIQFGSFSSSKPVKKARGVEDSLWNRTESGFLPLTHVTIKLLRDGLDLAEELLVELGL